MPFAATIDLDSLNGTNGFQVNAEAASSFLGDVENLGDINGDGFDDFAIGATGVGGGSRPGAVYVIFGNGSYPTNFSVSALNGANGFQVSGVSGDYAGTAITSADLNNDGINDLVIGAQRSGANDEGAAYVLYGKNTAVVGNFSADIAVGSLTGSVGFRIGGGAANLDVGATLDTGDFNGDGIDDLVIGAARAGGDYTGRVYVLFGQNGVSGPVNLSTLNGANGFAITNPFDRGNIGGSVANAGDINGDGWDDIVIGASTGTTAAYANPMAYVLYGKQTSVSGNFASSISLSQINGTNGFTLTNGGVYGSYFGSGVSSAGDVNGDGFDDFIVGARGTQPTGAVYLIFGQNSNFSSTFNVTTLNGSNGFQITGATPSANNGAIGGFGVAGLGDVNGDGFDDIIVTDYFADFTGVNAGSTYVIFGKASGWAASFSVTSIVNGTNGFRIDGENVEDRLQSVGTVGDINHDGANDIIVSSPNSDVVFTDGGAAWIIYGIPGSITNNGTPADDTLNGSNLNDTLSGGAGKDTLNGLGGDDTLNGGADNDFVYGGDGTDNVSGGDGRDTVDGGNGNDTVNGNDGDDKLYGQAGTDTLTGGTGNDYMYGGSENDNLSGGDGNDYLDGGTGADTMAGGLLNDVYIVDSTSDVVTENQDEGYDIIRTFVTLPTLAANVEGLQLQGTANLNGTGNFLANNIQGNSGNNTLDGGLGVDTINGDDGDDRIIGGLDNDLLRGGTGADTFVVAHAFGVILETDQVFDFSDAEGDRLDLSGAYAGTFVEVASFGKHAGEMTLTFASGITTVRLDVNGDGKADYQMKINGDVTDHATAWLL